jgi:heme-degrading monooxygenase HmoA
LAQDFRLSFANGSFVAGDQDGENGATAIEGRRGTRSLGVVEAIAAARDQCPHAAVRENAAAALEAIKGQGSEVLRQQVFLVLSTLSGWRGERALAVRRALGDFLATSAPRPRAEPAVPLDAYSPREDRSPPFHPRPPEGAARMVTIGMNYYVREGKEKIFEDACRSVIESLRQAEGHDESKIYRCVEAGDPEYLIVSRWTSEDAFRAFIRSDQFRKVTNWGAQNILSGPPRHTTYGAA